MLGLWVLSGMIAFTFVANKDARYTVPILPAVALLSVSWFTSSNPAPASKLKRALKPALAAVIVVWSVVSFINAQYPRDGYGLSYELPLFSWRIFARNYYGFDHRPSSDDWRIGEIILAVKAHRDQELANNAGQV